MGVAFEVRYGFPDEIFRRLTEEYSVSQVFTNRDYEPYAIERDAAVGVLLNEKGIRFSAYKDHVLFDENEVIKDDGRPYTVFTPYSKRWKQQYSSVASHAYSAEEYFSNFYRQDILHVPSLSEMGFTRFAGNFPSAEISLKTIKNYEKERDFPALEGTTRLGVHLRLPAPASSLSSR